jgi:type III pantothenate kinase
MVKVNLLAISVGNTRTRIGGFVDGELAETATFINQRQPHIGDAIAHAFAPLREKEDAVVMLTTVNPDVANEIEPQITNLTRRQIKRVERDFKIPIGRQLDPEAIVGEDRLINAAAAFDVMKQACVVVDAGTAITVDFVDGAGTFHGGAIAPGPQLMLDALHQRTALLPEVEFARPDQSIGHNTIDAMRVGAFHGTRGMVRELVEQFAQRVGQFPLVIATGGDAELLFRDFDLIDRVVPDLTLLGLSVTLRVALEQIAEE